MEEELKCSGCGEPNLHHDRIEIFDRGEDAVDGLHVTVTYRQVKTDRNLSGNPSSRRDGLKVYFWCEHCEAITVLSISQHKGTTYLTQAVKETKQSIIVNDSNPLETIEEIINRCKGLSRK